MNLAELKLGDKARIIGFQTGAACRQKMFAYGLLPGAELRLIRIAPMGDPMQIKLDGDITLSIRRSEGRYVEVELA